MPCSPTSRALDAVAALAEAAAQQRGVSLVGSDLRLFENRTTVGPSDRADMALVSPFALGRTYELLLAPKTRRKTGAHLTPETVARNLVAMMPSPVAGNTVLDPAVGGAAFLIAVADQLVAAGAPPAAVLGQLFGVDIDPGAVAVAEAALMLWGLDNGVAVRALPNMRQGDGLLEVLPRVSRVVGNPPFLNQLRSSSTHTARRRSALREKWGELVGSYTDDAWLFLAAGLDALDSDGVLAMVQPVSVLAARHGDPVRRHVSERASLRGLWLARDQVFDAAVQVCGVVLGTGDHSTEQVERCVGSDFSPALALATQPDASAWGSAAAATMNVPQVDLIHQSGNTIGDLASATAGFRDQFYGFVPFVSEWPSEDVPATHAKLVTVGMIDVLGLGWGTRSFKFAKRPFKRPVVDLLALGDQDPKLAEWVAARRRPKLLMATQTRIAEVWVDERGDAVPATPVVSVEPFTDDRDQLWMLAAALSAPALSAHFLATNFGTALSLNAMKIAARDVLTAPLPADKAAWREAAALLQSEPTDYATFASLMGRAYGTTEDHLASWWLDRARNQIGR